MTTTMTAMIIMTMTTNESVHVHLPIHSAHDETAYDPDRQHEPGVVPVGQIIPSTGPMAVDRRRGVVVRMMTTAMESVLLSGNTRSALL